jgi:hypothetical protein
MRNGASQNTGFSDAGNFERQWRHRCLTPDCPNEKCPGLVPGHFG